MADHVKWFDKVLIIWYEGSPDSENKCVETCDEGWEENGGRCFFWGREMKNWIAAEDFCREEGGHLATVNTDATMDFLFESMKTNNIASWVWIGGSDIEEEGVWKWADSTPWEDKFWAPGEPSNAGNNEDCIYLQNPGYKLNRKFNDWTCSKESHFLCSKKKCPTYTDSFIAYYSAIDDWQLFYLGPI